MLETPPLLTIRRNFRRPDPLKLEKLRDTPTGNIADCLRGRASLGAGIKPLSIATSEMQSVIGPAITCYNAPTDQLGVVGAFSEARKGDVVVASTEGCISTAVVGDLMLGIAKNIGVAGMVTDGAVRDMNGILKVEIPIFCSGINPDSPSRTGPGNVGFPVVIANRTIHSGDIIIGDTDGVVVVPQQDLDAVINKLELVKASESEMESKVENGLKVPDSWRKILDSDRTKYLD